MGKLSKRAKIWLIIGCTVGVMATAAGIIIGAMAINGVLFEEEGPYLPSGSGGGVYKPVIYLYPQEKTEATVKLGAPEKITVSYPQYTDGWKVLAEPSGKLTDLDTGRELYSLYWEGEDTNHEVTNEGFIVEGKDAGKFLEEKLAILGLNEKEAEEFIIYWLPKMQENEYNYVRFASADEIEKYMPLEVIPQPDTTIRILMVLRKIDEPINIVEQKLGPTPERNGFTVVEWGGNL